jgi:glycerol-1-phosphate dehydrogenase [NAD(P)+]
MMPSEKNLQVKMNIRDALASASDTRLLEIGSNILERVPDIFNSGFGRKKAVVVCDQTTFRVAGERVNDCFVKSGTEHLPPFIYMEPSPYAGIENVTLLEEFLKTNEAIPVVVGSGTLNDLTKLASARAGRPYMCVATAASMDGYTAFGASITYHGAKQTFPCPAPKAMVADVEIIRHAPPLMTASGYADLFAKVTAGADWILADALGVEPIDNQAWAIVQGGLRDALADPGGAKEGKLASVTSLIEGLILGGFAMQWSQSSRPASGAEHQFSHLWNMEHHTYLGKTPSHGFQVGVATLAITRLYEKMLQTPLDKIDLEKTTLQWDEWPVQEQRINQVFRDSGFVDSALTETRKKYLGKETLTKQLSTLKKVWPQLRKSLEMQLIPASEVEKMLHEAGAPTRPEQIGLSEERMKESFLKASYIRSRFTILDIALRTGYINQWLNELYR